jgi:hypothetical protein
MSEPKIAVAGLPSGSPPTAPKTPSSPPPPSKPPAPPTPPGSPAERGSALAIVGMVGFVVAAVVAGFFIVRAQTLQSDCKQAKSESAQRQTQLEAARAELVKAQGDAKAMSDETAKLQVQLEKAKSETTGALATAEKASGEAQKLQTQLGQANKDLAETKVTAKKAMDELAKLQAQMQAQLQAQSGVTTQAQPKQTGTDAAAAKPLAVNGKPMPVSVTFRKAEVGDGMALVLQNASTAALAVSVRFTNPTSGANKDYHLAMDAGASKELGSLGAWLLASGDKIEVAAPGYNSILKTAP